MGVRLNMQVVTGQTGLARGHQQLKNSGELPEVIRSLNPPAGVPTVIGNHPRPTGRTRVSQGGTVSSSRNRHASIVKGWMDS